MADFDRPEEPKDPKKLRSAAVDALKDAARQNNPREFNRLTLHARALIERARAIGHGRQNAVPKAAEMHVSRRNGQVKPRSPHKIIEFIGRLWCRSA